MAQAQTTPKPPPGFVLQGVESTPAPPPGFVLDTKAEPTPPPGFVVKTAGPDVPTTGLPKRPQPGPDVAGSTSTPSAVMPAEDALRPPQSTPPPPPGFVLESGATAMPGAPAFQQGATGAMALEGKREVSAGPASAPGMLSPGNIDLTKRPKVRNPDGSISTVRSISFNMDGKEIVVPTVSDDGRIMSDDEAIQQYIKTGRNLGTFDTPENATAFANRLHEDQARFYGSEGESTKASAQNPAFNPSAVLRDYRAQIGDPIPEGSTPKAGQHFDTIAAPNVIEAAQHYGITPKKGETDEELRRRIYEIYDAQPVTETPRPGPFTQFGIEKPPPPADRRGFFERDLESRLKTNEAAGKGFVQGLELDRPLGLTPEARKEWQQLGVFPDPNNHGFLEWVLDPAKRVAQATVETGSIAGDLILRPVNGLINAGVKTITQTARNFGMSDSQADSLERELNKDIMLVTVYSAGITPGSVVRGPGAMARGATRRAGMAGERKIPAARAGETPQTGAAPSPTGPLHEADTVKGAALLRRQRDTISREIDRLEYSARYDPKARKRLDVLQSQRAIINNILGATEEAPKPPPGFVLESPERAKTKTVYRGVRHETDLKSGEPIYVTEDKNLADTHAYGGGRIEAYDIDESALKTYDIGNPSLPLSTNVIDDIGKNPADVKKLRDAGFNAVIHSKNPFREGEIVLLDRSLLKKEGAKPRATPAEQNMPPAQQPADARAERWEQGAREFERRQADEAVAAIPKPVIEQVESGRIDALKAELRGLENAPNEPEIRAHRIELNGRIAELERAEEALNRQRRAHEPIQLGLFNYEKLRARTRAAIDRHTEGMREDTRRRLRFDAERRVISDAETAALQSMREKIDSPDPRKFFEASRLSWTERQITDYFDALRPLRYYAEKVGRQHGVPPDLLPYREMSLVSGLEGVMEAAHEYGSLRLTPNGNIRFAGPGLNAAFHEVRDDLENTLLYFVARRADELHGRGIQTPFTNDEIRAALKLGRQNPKIIRAFEKWQKFDDDMLDFLQQSGVVDNETKLKFKQAGRNYVPFHRAASEPDPFEPRPDNRSLFERIKGGDGKLREVLENISMNTNAKIDMAVKNRAKQFVYDWVDRYDLRDLAQPVPTIEAAELLKVADKDMAEIIKNLGLTDDAASRRVLSFYRPIAEDLDIVYRNGKPYVYRIKDPQLMKAMHAFSPNAYLRADSILGGMAQVSNVLRRGATLTPDFMVRNLIKDAQVAYIQGGEHFTPIVDTMRGLTSRMTTDENYWLMMANGGGWASRFKGETTAFNDLGRMYRMHGIDPARVLDSPQKIAAAFKGGLRKALDKAEAVSSSFETANRLGEFRKVAGEKGSLREAALAAREVSTDFGRRGASPFMRAFTATVPFLNAHIQGVERSVRALRANPARVARRAATMITVPSLALYALNKDDPRYRQLPDWIRDQHWVLFADDSEDASAFLIPRGFEWGLGFAALPERLIEAIEQQNGRLFANQFLKLFTTAVVPNHVPQVVNPPLELATNKSFSGAPIVPERLQKVRPSEQFTTQTSPTIRELARGLHQIGVEMSPLKAQHLFRGYTAALGSLLLSGADTITRLATGERAPERRPDEIPIAGRFVATWPLKYTRQEADFYKIAEAADEASSTFKIMLGRFTRPDLGSYEQKLAAIRPAISKVRAAAADIREKIRTVENNPRLSETEKRRKKTELLKAKAKLFDEFARQVPEDVAQHEGILRPPHPRSANMPTEEAR